MVPPPAGEDTHRRYYCWALIFPLSVLDRNVIRSAPESVRGASPVVGQPLHRHQLVASVGESTGVRLHRGPRPTVRTRRSGVKSSQEDRSFSSWSLSWLSISSRSTDTVNAAPPSKLRVRSRSRYDTRAFVTVAPTSSARAVSFL